MVVVVSPTTLPDPPALDAANAQRVQALPYTIPGEAEHSGATALAWIDSQHLVYVGQAVSYQSACGGCPLDTVATRLEMLRREGALQEAAQAVMVRRIPEHEPVSEDLG